MNKPKPRLHPLHHWATAAAAGLTMATASSAVLAQMPQSAPPSPQATRATSTEMAGRVSGPMATQAGVSIVSGGADVEEFTDLNRQAADYQLKLILAAKHSGAYLADVDVVVRSLPSREVVLEHRSEGPLVLAQLPPGRYEVVASYGQVLPGRPTTQTRTVTVPASRNLAQMVMYFDTGDDLSPRSPPQYSTPPVAQQ